MSAEVSRPVIVVEDDVILRLFQVLLDPDTPAERVDAFRHWLAHDLPDFAGWCSRVRGQAGSLYPAQVRLVRSREELQASLPDALALIVESLPVGPEELDIARRLRVVQQFGTITRNIDAEACTARGVTLLTLRRRVNAACAEMTVALMLTLAKKLHRIGGRISVDQLMEAGYAPTTYDGRHTSLSGWSRVTGLRILNGSTLGIIGLGEIGRELASRAAAFGMHVLYYQRHRLAPEEEGRYQAHYAPLERLLAESDWVSVQLPLTASTRGLIDRERLAQLKAGACLVNTSRAEIVDRAALLDALASGRLGGLGLDTLYEEPGRADDPLLAFENVVLTPRIAAAPRFTTLDDAEEVAVRLARALGLSRPPEPGPSPGGVTPAPGM